MAAIQTDPQYKLRLSPDLKARIETAAQRNNRSMNAEIVSRLEQTFEAETKPVTPWLEDRTSRAMPLVAADIARIIEETSRTAARLTVEQMQQQYGQSPETREFVLSRLQTVVDVVEERMRESVAAEAKGALSQLSGRSFKDRIRKLDTNVLVDMVNRIEGALEQTPNLLNATPPTKGQLARELGGDPFDVQLPIDERPRALNVGPDTTPSTPTRKRPSRAR